jgi:carbonic anhydrase
MNTQDSASQAAMTPSAARQLLEEGNARFVQQSMASRDLAAQVAATTGGQWPFAAILGCIDSRVPPELVFDQGLGDLFSVRIAGNFANEDILGSLEFACKVAGSKLVVVLGHRSCGAVKGACDGVELGNLTAMLGKLRPAVDAVTEPADPAQRTSGNGDFVQAVAECNVRQTVAAIRAQSEVLRELESAGGIAIVGAMYDIASGAVTFLEEGAGD